MRLLKPLFVLGLLLLTAVEAQAARKLALVIGNDAYANLEVLQKAVADARSYAGMLEEQGFAVTLRTDSSRQQMDDAIADFIDAIAPGDTAAFVYSGHGWSDGLQNYVLGTDIAASGSQERLAGSSIPIRNGANGVLDRMERRGAILKVAIIDACRNNPFTAAAGGRNAGVERGLVRIDPPQGTFLVFSASPGQTALDRLSDRDADANSVFTRVFVPLVRSGLALEDAMNEAQQAVLALARTADGHAQQPAYVDEFPGKTCLAGACAAPGGAAVVPPPDAGAEVVAALLDVIARAADRDLVAGFANHANAQVRDAAAARLVALGVLPVPRENTVPDGRPAPPIRSMLASAGADGTVRLWDAASGVPIRTLADHPGKVMSVAFSPNGAILASGGDDKIVRLWDPASGDVLATLAGHTDWVSAVAFSPDGRYVASASNDRTVRLWDAGTGDLVHTLTGHGQTVTAIAFSPDGGMLASASWDRTIKLWRVASGELIGTLVGHAAAILSVAFSPDGALLASSDYAETVKLWNLPEGLFRNNLSGHAGLGAAGWVAFSPDGILASLGSGPASGSGTIRTWDTASGLPALLLLEPAEMAHAVAFSADGALLASGSSNGTVPVWDVASGRLVRTLTGHAGAVASVAFSPVSAVPAVAGR